MPILYNLAALIGIQKTTKLLVVLLILSSNHLLLHVLTNYAFSFIEKCCILTQPTLNTKCYTAAEREGLFQTLGYS